METIHTGAAAITFPTTPEAFIAYQEQLIGRKLAEHERSEERRVGKECTS